MSASAAIAKRRVQAIARGLKVQNNNTTLSTLNIYNGAQQCGPLNYRRIRYYKPNCRYPCIIPPIRCVPAGILDGGILSSNSIDGGGPSGYSITWDGGSPGSSQPNVYDGNTGGNNFASGGSPNGVLSNTITFDGGSPAIVGDIIYDGQPAPTIPPEYIFDGGDPLDVGPCIYDGGVLPPIICISASGFDGGQPSTINTYTFDGGSGNYTGQCVYTGGSP
jgi:hypothetical protein